MEIFLLSFLVIAMSVAGLALGVIARKRPIRAGCGTYNGPEVRAAKCEVCAGAGSSKHGLAPRQSPVGTMPFKIDVSAVAQRESDPV